MSSPDREALKIAIDSLEIETNMSQSTQWADLKKMVIDAARKHLETLPKRQWRVTSLIGGEPAAPYVTSNYDHALDHARNVLSYGHDDVNVREWCGQ